MEACSEVVSRRKCQHLNSRGTSQVRPAPLDHHRRSPTPHGQLMVGCSATLGCSAWPGGLFVASRTFRGARPIWLVGREFMQCSGRRSLPQSQPR